MTAKKAPLNVQSELDQQAAEAVRVIGSAAKIAAERIADAASEAHKVVSDAAATSVRVLHLKSADDHDLLIELKTRMEGLKTDIKNLTDGTTKRISDLEEGKADKVAFNDLCNEVHGVRENRLRKLENKTANFWIAFSLYSLAVVGMIGLLVFHILKGG